MNNALVRTALCLAAALLAGCASPVRTPQGNVPTPADAGPRPTDTGAVVREALRTSLNDPVGAQVSNISGPTFLVMQPSILGVGGYGWGICSDVNAKNFYGVPVGKRRHVAIWREGHVVFQGIESPTDAIGSAQVLDACRTVAGG